MLNVSLLHRDNEKLTETMQSMLTNSEFLVEELFCAYSILETDKTGVLRALMKLDTTAVKSVNICVS